MKEWDWKFGLGVAVASNTFGTAIMTDITLYVKLPFNFQKVWWTTKFLSCLSRNMCVDHPMRSSFLEGGTCQMKSQLQMKFMVVSQITKPAGPQGLVSFFVPLKGG